MLPRIKIRGIYSTALTRLALDYGFQEPGRAFRKNQRTVSWNSRDDGEYEILIRDRDDLQGIEVRGEADYLCESLVHYAGIATGRRHSQFSSNGS